jgi:hypothetical protein
MVAACRHQLAHAREKFAGVVLETQAEEVAICVLAISTAMPLVNPITTGRGMNCTADAQASEAHELPASPRPSWCT